MFCGGVLHEGIGEHSKPIWEHQYATNARAAAPLPTIPPRVPDGKTEVRAITRAANPPSPDGQRTLEDKALLNRPIKRRAYHD